MRRWVWVGMMAALGSACWRGAVAQTPMDIPTAAPRTAVEQTFKDPVYGVEFKVPAGWAVTKRDGEVSTFRNDAKSAAATTRMRAVESMEFNPFPQSTLAGALVYFSVDRAVGPASCAKQATGGGEAKDTMVIGGLNFVHGHEEQYKVCVEARDEVYTAYRKGACYRFDLTLNTFCSETSGAQEISAGQIKELHHKMEDVLGSVKFAAVTKPVAKAAVAPAGARKALPKGQ